MKSTEKTVKVTPRATQRELVPPSPQRESKLRQQEQLTVHNQVDAWLDDLQTKFEAIKKNGKHSSTIETIVQGTSLPFTKEIIELHIPPDFKVPHVDSYDGSKDLVDHIETYNTHMPLQGAPDEIMCRAFPITLKGPAIRWFQQSSTEFNRVLH
jgi:hypothetical protein